ncbi:hypothetical protein UFVDC4_00077 [Staphylococcus phage vB_SauM-UFV_DC4]|nr:hypothetical protein UFVDC4_00077 [Staphylococcus phage vB_SauM-UFV_DC4]
MLDNVIILSALSIAFFLTTLTFIFLTIHFRKELVKNVKMNKNYRDKIAILEKQTTGKDVLDSLNSMIDEFLKPTYDLTIEETYMDLKLDNPLVSNRNITISEQRKNVILEDVFEKFMNYLSDDFKNKLSLIYKEDEIENMVLDIMYYKLTVYIKERNELQKNS